MSWRLVVRPDVEEDIAEAVFWYEEHQPGLGAEFVEEISKLWTMIAANPFLRSRKHPRKNVRWRYPERFPYRIVFEVFESTHTVVVIAIIHAARHDRHGKRGFRRLNPLSRLESLGLHSPNRFFSMPAHS
ncbi:MAG: hypothetical protein JWM16_762 [Verrucomicrobiales bacterium]|nr:hypothetical protein [Verrucomicrobiales bacterium]